MASHGVLQKDDNGYPVAGGVSSADATQVLNAKIDSVTGRLLTSSAGAGGTVTTVSVVTANGFAGTVANPTTTPAITLSTTITGTLQGNGTVISASKLALTQPATGSTLTVADGKTLTANNTLTFTGTDGSSVAFGSGGTVLYGNQSITLSGDVTGSGSTSIATTLATVNSNVGTFGSATVAPIITVNGKGLTTAVTTATITPAIGSITGLGTGVATFLATPSSANLASALTDETGSGLAVFNNKPTFLGTIQTITAVAALALDGSAGNMFTKTIGTGSTFTQSNFSTGQNFIVTVTGAFTITWFSGITWVTSGTTAPTQAALTTYGFTCTGTNAFLGYLVGTQ